MKLAIIGSRTFGDWELFYKAIDTKWRGSDGSLISEIVSGGAEGADTMGANYAVRVELKLQVFYPDWYKWGKRAGFIRNVNIIEACDEVLAFWDGVSKGTAHSLRIAKQMKKPTTIIYF